MEDVVEDLHRCGVARPGSNDHLLRFGQDAIDELDLATMDAVAVQRLVVEEKFLDRVARANPGVEKQICRRRQGLVEDQSRLHLDRSGHPLALGDPGIDPLADACREMISLIG